jgi:hypothetical protein
MSVFSMAVVAALVFAEKVLPYGYRLARGLAGTLVALGIWVASAPGSIPGLTEPDSGKARQAREGTMGIEPSSGRPPRATP